MRKLLKIKVSGRVQGVFFRYSAKVKADELGIVGFARNEADGSVYIEAEGEEKVLEQFLEWCKEGSEFAAVENVEYASTPELKHFDSFTAQ